MKGNFFPVEISTFRNSSKEIGFDVYLKLSDENFAHVFSKNTGLDYKRLAAYIQKGVKNLYIRNEDEGLFKDYLQIVPDRILSDPKVANAKKVSILLQMAEQNISELYSVLQVSHEAAQMSSKVVNNLVKLLADNPKSMATLIKTASHGDYLFFHSVSVCVISMFLAKASGEESAKMLEVCALGGLIHDVGLTMLPKDIVESPTELTPAQWREMRLHPTFGLKMVEGTPNIPDEVRYIIMQHHEEPNGLGYPSGLRGPVIFYPAKIVSLADSFCALISKRPFREAYTVDQALGIIHNEVGKFDPKLVEVLENLFGSKKKIAA